MITDTLLVHENDGLHFTQNLCAELVNYCADEKLGPKQDFEIKRIVTGVHNQPRLLKSRSVNRPRFNWIFCQRTVASGYTIFSA